MGHVMKKYNAKRIQGLPGNTFQRTRLINENGNSISRNKTLFQ